MWCVCVYVCVFVTCVYVCLPPQSCVLCSFPSLCLVFHLSFNSVEKRLMLNTAAAMFYLQATYVKYDLLYI